MSLFNALLHGLKQKIDAQNTYKDVVIVSIKEIVNITLTHDAIISLKEGILVLQVTPTVKTALLLKKEKVIALLQQKGLKIVSIR